MMEAIFRDIEKKHLSEEILIEEDPTSSQTISGVAALCSTILTNRPQLEGQVIDWLSKGQGGSIQTVGLRRALVVNFADRAGEQGFCPYIYNWLIFGTESLRSLLTKCLEQFGDKFYIKHVPTRCQEGISFRSSLVLCTVDEI